MTWLIIFIVLAVIIGPVLYLLPNAKDKRLTALRMKARGMGFTIQLSTLPKLDPSADERVSAGGKQLDPRLDCAAYQLPMGQNDLQRGHVTLQRVPDAPTVTLREVTPGWALTEESNGLWALYDREGAGVHALLKAAQTLPEDCIAVAVDHRYVACYWRERASAESEILEALHTALAGLREDYCRRLSAPQNGASR